MNSIYELRKIPFIRLVIPLVTGLAGGIHFKIPFTLLPVIAFILFMFFIIIMLINKLSRLYKYRLFFGLSINAFIITAGILLAESKLNMHEKTLNRIKNSGYYLCRIINQPELKSGAVKVLIRIVSYKDSVSWYKCNTRVLTYFQRDSNSNLLSNGDIITLKTRLDAISNPGNPCEFDYKKFLKFRGIIFQSYVRPGTWKRIGHRNSLKTFAVQLRNNLLGLYKKYGIKDNEFAVISAFTLGYKDALNPSIKKSYASAGAMHFIAVSGLHVGIIFYVLNLLFKFPRGFKYLKVIKLTIILLILWFYALLAGLAPSVIRATVMFTLIQICISLNRPLNIFNILAVTAFFMLLSDPMQISDIGFQLSFISVLGIIFFQPRLYRLLIFKNLILDKMWILFTGSLSAQIGIFPVVIYYFHHFPVYSWLTNIIIIFPVAISIYLAILMFIFSWAVNAASFIAEILNLLLKFINFCVAAIEKLPLAVVENIYSNSAVTVMLYITVSSISMFAILKNKLYLKVTFLSVILLLALNFIRYYDINKQKRIVVFNINKFTAINFIKGRNSYLFTDIDPGSGNRLLLNSAYNYWLKKGVIEKNRIFCINDCEGKNMAYDNIDELYVRQLHDNLFINFMGKRLLLLYNADLLEYINKKKFKLNYLIVTRNSRPHKSTLAQLRDIDNIIIDSSNNLITRQFWTKACKLYGINCINISLEGALKIEL